MTAMTGWAMAAAILASGCGVNSFGSTQAGRSYTDADAPAESGSYEAGPAGDSGGSLEAGEGDGGVAADSGGGCADPPTTPKGDCWVMGMGGSVATTACLPVAYVCLAPNEIPDFVCDGGACPATHCAPCEGAGTDSHACCDAVRCTRLPSYEAKVCDQDGGTPHYLRCGDDAYGHQNPAPVPGCTPIGIPGSDGYCCP